MDKCIFCKKPIGLLEERVLITWRKRKGERRVVIAYACEPCGDSHTTDYCQVIKPVL